MFFLNAIDDFHCKKLSNLISYLKKNVKNAMLLNFVTVPCYITFMSCSNDIDSMISISNNDHNDNISFCKVIEREARYIMYHLMTQNKSFKNLIYFNYHSNLLKYVKISF